MKRYLVAGMVAAAAVALTACDTASAKVTDGPAPHDVRVHTVNLPDNRQVLCVFEASGGGGGLSCDWANAK